MNAIDTNVWVYAYDARDGSKRRKAQELIASLRPILLPWQVGCEFIAAARKLEPSGFTCQMAWEALDDIQAMAEAVLLPVRESWGATRHLQEQYGIAFWDALLVAACLSGGVETLYSEDFSHGQRIDGLTVVNPFV